MKRTRIPALLLVAMLGLTACGKPADLSVKPATPHTTVDDVQSESSIRKEAHAGGYGDQRVLFFFILAYLFAPAVL